MSDFLGNIDPKNLASALAALTARVAALEQRKVEADSLDQMTNDLGTMRQGELLSAESGQPDDGDYTGLFWSHEGYEFTLADVLYLINLGGMAAGILEFGLSSTDGSAIFAGGDGVINSEGINARGIRYGFRHYATDPDGNNPRFGRFEMFYPDGETIPALGLGFYDATVTTELVANGDYETGDLTNWAETHTASDTNSFEVTDTNPKAGTYSAQAHTWFKHGIAPDGTQTFTLTSDPMSVTAGQAYSSDGNVASLIDGVVLAGHRTQTTVVIQLDWYDGDAALISSSVMYSVVHTYPGKAWNLVSASVVAPAGAETAQIYCSAITTNNFTGSSEWASIDVWFDEFSLQALSISTKLYFGPDLTYFDGSASRKMFPRSATKLANEFLAFTAAGAAIPMVLGNAAAQVRMGFYTYLDTANCNDGDRYKCNMFLEAGTYTVQFYGYRSSNSGKVDLYVDGAMVSAGHDLYNGATDYDYHFEVADVAVLGSGVHLVEWVVNGKNGSSTDYCVRMTYTEAKQASF